MKKVFLFSFSLLFVTSFSQTHIWNGSAGDNDWFNAVNWDAGTVPDASSTVLIEGTGTETVEIISGVAQANTLNLNLNTILNIENNLTITGDFHNSSGATVFWRKGIISGGTIQNYGLLQIENPDAKYLDGTTINNHNAITILNSGVIHLDNTVTIHNLNKATISINSSGGIVEDSGIATFNNLGSIVLDAPSPKSFYMIFDMNNEGVIEVRESHAFLFLVASQNFTNFPNGTLMGEGTFDITANFSNNGLIDPASNGTTGTLDVLNNLNFPSEAILKIDVISATEYDVLEVFGSPTIEGVLDVNLLSNLNIDDELTVITSSNSLSCNLPSEIIATYDNHTDYFFDVICGTNEVILKVSEILLLGREDNFKKNYFVAFPNPAKQQVTFEFPAFPIEKNSAYRIELFSMLGQKINEISVIEETTSFDVSQLSSGIYFAHLVSEKGLLATTKIVVE
ncbi:MAG: T9SS type A sorting domain-containing protein [Flavobacteriaceae bacterium]